MESRPANLYAFSMDTPEYAAVSCHSKEDLFFPAQKKRQMSHVTHESEMIDSYVGVSAAFGSLAHFAVSQ